MEEKYLTDNASYPSLDVFPIVLFSYIFCGKEVRDIGETIKFGQPKIKAESNVFRYPYEIVNVTEEPPREDQQHVICVIYKRVAGWFTGQREKTDDTNLVS